MKTALKVITILMFIHVLGVIGFVGWLGMSDRLSEDRARQVFEMFKPTVAEDEAQAQQAAELAAQAQAQADRTERINTSMGMGTAANQLDVQQKHNELLLAKIERSRRELEDLQRNLELSRQNMDRKRQEMAEIKSELEAKLTAIEAQLNDAGFKKAIEMYEQLPAGQVKAMFVELMQRNQSEQVVAYLHAMDERRAAKVLAEFKQEAELSAAVELTERLRARGSTLVSALENPQ